MEGGALNRWVLWSVFGVLVLVTWTGGRKYFVTDSKDLPQRMYGSGKSMFSAFAISRSENALYDIPREVNGNHVTCISLDSRVIQVSRSVELPRL